MKRTKISFGVSVLLLAVMAACGGSDEGGSDTADGQSSVDPSVAGAPAVDISKLTGDAATGERLFAARGCIGCHLIGGGRLVGPDLEGVTERRERAWVFAMVINPDSMIRNDETARAMLAEYMTAMTAMGVTHQEAADLYAYLEGNGS